MDGVLLLAGDVTDEAARVATGSETFHCLFHPPSIVTVKMVVELDKRRRRRGLRHRWRRGVMTRLRVTPATTRIYGARSWAAS